MKFSFTKFLFIILMFASFSNAKAKDNDEIIIENYYRYSRYRIVSQENKTVAVVTDFYKSVPGNYGPYSITIPETIEYEGTTYTVTEIDREAYYAWTGLIDVTIPNSVTIIGEKAFMGSRTLEKVVFGNSVSVIGDKAFSECEALDNIIIPNSVTSIGNGAFWKCRNLKNLILGKNVGLLGKDAFGECGMMNSVLFSGKTEGVDNAFDFSYPEKCAYPVSMNEITKSMGLRFPYPDDAIVEGGVVYDSDKNQIYFCSSVLEDLEVPETVTTINDKAFYYCKNLISVTLPSKLNKIGKESFRDCTSLETIDIPGGVAAIEDKSFSNCSNLKFISLPENLNSIGTEAFINCKNLKTIILPDNLNYLGERAFKYCGSLSELKLSENLETLPEEVFSECSALQSLLIPDKMKSIESKAFYHCYALKSLNIGSFLQYFGEKVFTGCTQLNQVDINPDNQYFSNIGGMVMNKERSILYFYPSASGEINVPDGINTISAYAFEDSKELEVLILPSSTKSIGDYAFFNTSLSKVYLYAPEPPTLGERVFYCLDKVIDPEWGDYYVYIELETKIFVPKNSLDSYLKDPSWESRYKYLYPLDSEETMIENIYNLDNCEIFTVYTLDGKLVKPVNNLRELKPGFYIVNGKKILISNN